MTDPTVVPGADPAPATPEPAAPKKLSDYARELYGNEFYGKPEEAKPTETEEAKPVDAQAGEEVPQKEEPTEGGKPEEGKQPAPAEDTGEIPIASVSELVEHLETSPDWFNSLKVNVQVDGIPTEATVGDLIKNYQITEAAEHRLEKAKAMIQEKAEAWNAKHAQYDQQMAVLGTFIQAEEARLESDTRAVDPKLRDEDPAEWAARITEFDQRRAHIGQLKANAYAQWQANQYARTQEATAVRDQVKAEQSQILMQKLPEWQDTKQANVEKTKIAEYLLREEVGFQPQELDQLLDHRQVLIARKAMLYDESRGSVDTAKKRVATVPKIMKSGAPKAREQLASERLAALRDKMVKTGHPDDALAYTLAKRGAR